MPNPEEVTEKDTLEKAQPFGMYQNADEEHPAVLGTDKVLYANGKIKNPRKRNKKRNENNY